jgi:hypothetical protein
VIGAALLAAAIAAAGPGADSLVVRVPRATRAPVLDGRLDDETWKSAAILDNWVQVKPGDNVAPVAKTIAYLSYDRTHFYVAVRAWDDRAKVRAVLHERDAVIRSGGQDQGQDYVGFRIDTFNDQRQAYGIAINPLGLQGDGIEVEGTGFTEWDGEFDSKGVLLEDGWSVEISIPLRTLRYPARDQQQWGLAMTRGYGRAAMEDSPIPRDRNLACSLCQTMTLVGIRDIASSRAIEFNPTLVTRGSQSRPELGRPWDKAEGSVDVGANLKFGLTPGLTLDGTVNPDFSQVEADAGQLDINNRFALYFPEKRPFFLEGADIFQTRFPLPGQDAEWSPPPINLVYTRQIVDPAGGVKLSGQAGAASVGLISALDDYPGYVIEDSVAGLSPRQLDPYAGERATDAVARGQFDLLNGFVGATGTWRAFGGGQSWLGSADARFRFGENLTFRFLGARSDTEEADVNGQVTETLAGILSTGDALDAALDSLPDEVRDLDGETRAGSALQAQLEWASRHWQFGGGYLDITEGFETQLGFTPRTDLALFSGFLRYIYRGTGFIQEFKPSLRVEQGYEHAEDRLFSLGERTDFLTRLDLDVTLPAATSVGAGYARQFIQYEEIDFPDLDRGYFYVSTRPLRQVSASLFIRAGEEVIFDDVVDEGDPLPNFFYTLSGSLGLRPVAPLRVDLSWSSSRVWRRTDDATRESLYAESAIPRVVVRWQLSPRLGFRGIGEYRMERYFERKGTVADKAENFYLDFLASYIIHPNQSVQVGWSQAGEGELLMPREWTQRGGLVKLSYVWRL